MADFRPASDDAPVVTHVSHERQKTYALCVILPADTSSDAGRLVFRCRTPGLAPASVRSSRPARRGFKARAW
jgi:hypothetical protein